MQKEAKASFIFCLKTAYTTFIYRSKAPKLRIFCMSHFERRWKMADEIKTIDVEITPEMEEELNAMGKGNEEEGKEE